MLMKKVIITSKVTFLPLNFMRNEREYIHDSCLGLSYSFLSAVEALEGGLTAICVNSAYTTF